MIELLVALYLVFLGVIVSVSAKNRTRFLIGVELQVLGALLLALLYASKAPIIATLAIVAIALEALKIAAAVELRRKNFFIL